MLMLSHRSLYLGVRVAALPAFAAPRCMRLLLIAAADAAPAAPATPLAPRRLRVGGSSVACE